IIVHAVHFIAARRPRRIRTGHFQSIDHFHELLDERRLSGAGWGGNDEQHASLYSIFWTCSRIFSSSALAEITRFDTRSPSAFDPIVFTSRFISCSRKSSLRPHGSGDCASAAQWARCARNRAISSLISERAAVLTISWAIRFGLAGRSLSPCLAHS